MPYASPAWSENSNETTIETQKFVKLWGRPELVGDARLLFEVGVAIVRKVKSFRELGLNWALPY